MIAQLPVLNHRFNDLRHYQTEDAAYSLLPFRSLPLDRDRQIITNFGGEYLVLPREKVHELIRKQIPRHSRLYDDLRAKHFITDSASSISLELLAAQYRTKHVPLSNFTALHLFVVTLRCDHSCPYCQVSRQSEDKAAFDMTRPMADKAMDFLFRSPSPQLKVEFQGGEPLLNFELIQYVVNEVERRNAALHRDIQFVITTNLASLTDAHLDFFGDHNVYISTSLDGPRELHNANRPRPGRDSYERTIDGIRRVREALGPDKISALMTTTKGSLSQPVAIIDEYLRQGFKSIFLRSISPYGFAVKSGLADGYETDEWAEFYRSGLNYVIELNRRGVPFVEHYSALILRKMLTPYATGYVDLQSPSGMGINVIVFNYDGDIYATDEGRMLAEMGDKKFRLGNLFDDSYEAVMTSDALLGPLMESMAEVAPGCSDCGVQPFCGCDPVYHHRTQGDVVGFKPTSGFCRKNMNVIRHLIRLLEDEPTSAEVLRNWI